MYQLAHVANTILYRAKNEHVAISPMKLQKLLYFLYGECLYEDSTPLFAERFEAWRYGPVLNDVYQAFKRYGANKIREYMPDANGLYQIVDTDRDKRFRKCFDAVWDDYSDKTGIQLSEITHQSNGAWYEALAKKEHFLTDKSILDEMRERKDGKCAK